MSPPPAIQYLTARDGVQLAWCQQGQGPPFVFVRGWMSHLEAMWAAPAFQTFFGSLARRVRLIRYDTRGTGLSVIPDRDPDFEALVTDLESLVDHLRLDGIVLMGSTFGGPIAIAYASRNPQRVSRLILEGTYARLVDEAVLRPDQVERALEMQRSIVGALRSNPRAARAMLQMMTSPEEGQTSSMLARYVDTLHRRARDVLASLYTIGFAVDVSGLLPSISTPTLVLHRVESASVGVALGRRLASQIPGARFVPLPGSAHNCWDGDPRPAFDAICEFLDLDLRLEAAGLSASPRTILFTDLEGSVSLTQALGDAEAQRIVRIHNAAVRDAVGRHGGLEVKHTGDGIMASFGSASGALRCAIDIQRALAAHGANSPDLPGVRTGINAGEPVSEDDDLFGTAVQVAARICAAACAGQILVSDVVYQLVAGKDFSFTDSRVLLLRGVTAEVRVHEVGWQSQVPDPAQADGRRRP